MLPTSYFSSPAEILDPEIFEGEKVRPGIRTGLIGPLMHYLTHAFRKPDKWVHVWLAGSGASYQWQAARDPGDLDVLLGVDFVKFREANEGWRGFSDNDVASMLNANLRVSLTEEMRGWHGYDVTYFVNPDGKDIRNLKPYAAYDLTKNEWTIRPDPHATPPFHHSWERQAQADNDLAQDIVRRYSAALSTVKGATNPAHRANADVSLHRALDQARALFAEIHEGRHQAFSRVGEGYSDIGNYRWQAGKARGTVQALRDIKDYAEALEEEHAQATYGIELPDAETLIRRAIASYMVTD